MLIYKMPTAFTCYINKSSESANVHQIASTTYPSDPSANITITSGHATLLSQPNSDPSSVIGSVFFTKSYNYDLCGNTISTFVWDFNFDGSGGFAAGNVQSQFYFFNQASYSNGNPTEIIPSGQTSVTVQGILNGNLSTTCFANQYGYVIKTKSSTSNYRRYDFYYPQAVMTYTNVFNSLPQPSVAPL